MLRHYYLALSCCPLTTLQVSEVIALHSDTKHLVSSSSDGTVRVWVPAQQRCIQVLEPFSCPCTSLASHQASLFLGGQRGQMAAFSTTTWQAEFEFHDVSLRSARAVIRLTR